MMLFGLSDNSLFKHGSPWACSTSAPLVLGEPCPACGLARSWHREGPGHAIIDKGRKWTDAIGSGSGGPFLVSKRVVDDLHEAGATGFEAYPVQIDEIQSVSLLRLPKPDYYYLRATGSIDIDPVASGIRAASCPECGRYRRSSHREMNVRSLVVYEHTWDGSDLFRPTNWVGIFCTERVLLLARQKRWTNVRFVPMDAVGRHATAWEGIDYLGKNWPPKQWYPPAPSEGRTLDQCLEELRQRPVDHWTIEAMLDFEHSAVEPLKGMLHSSDQLSRENAAHLLTVFRAQYLVDLSDDLKARILEARPHLEPSMLD